jgi:spoIIIJ-associated protein
MEGVEASGKTVEEAIENALDELDADRDEVEVEVLSEGDGEATVRVTLLAESDEDDDEEDEDEESDDEEDEDDDEADEGDDEEDGEDEEEAADDGEAESERSGGRREREPRPPGPAVAILEQEGIDEAEYAARMLDKLLELMGIEADVSIRDPETPGDGLGMANAVLDVEGEDLGILIGRRGETLTSLQFLLNLMVAQQLGRQEFFTVDVEGYRRRREDSLMGLARRMADQARRTGKPVDLEPMPANERRIIHMALADNRNVSTSSSGEGEDRAVTISPRGDSRR